MAIVVETSPTPVWTTAAGNKTTASFSPPAGAYLLVWTLHSAQDGASTISDSLGGSWVALGSTFSYSTAQAGTIQCFARTTGVSGASMTVTSAPAGTSTGGGLVVMVLSGVDGYGTTPLFASGGQADQAAATPAPVLDATPDGSQACFICIVSNTNGSANGAIRTGYTEHNDQGYASPASGIETQYLASGETSATLTTGAAAPSQFGSMAVALDAAGPQGLTGTLFTKAGTFIQGALSSVYALAGVLFTKAPTFPQGVVASAGGTYTTGSAVVASDVPIIGATFSKAPTFPQGAVTSTYALTGVLFTKTPSFPQGTLTATYGLSGVTFTKAPTFGTGAFSTTYALSGTTFTRVPAFPQGVVDAGGGQQNLTGTTFQRTASFPQGTVTSTYALAGVTFQKTPTFPQGQVTTGAVGLTGTTFQKAPSFPQGSLNQSGAPQSLTGSTFVRAPSFGTGSVTVLYGLGGTTFTKAPVFVQGAISTTAGLIGIVFSKAPTFPTGVVGAQGALSGITYAAAPTFFVGALAVIDMTPEWPVSSGTGWPGSTGQEWLVGAGTEWPLPPTQ